MAIGAAGVIAATGAAFALCADEGFGADGPFGFFGAGDAAPGLVAGVDGAAINGSIGRGGFRRQAGLQLVPRRGAADIQGAFEALGAIDGLVAEVQPTLDRGLLGAGEDGDEAQKAAKEKKETKRRYDLVSH